MNVALGNGDLGVCATEAANDGGPVTVVQIVSAVNNVLIGCP